jgi:hypothetical protein
MLIRIGGLRKELRNMTVLRNMSVDFQDSSALGAFGGLRTVASETVFDSKFLYDKGPLLWDESITGSGTSVWGNATIQLQLTGTGSIIRQTFQRFNYQPGKGQLVYLTGMLGIPVASTSALLGLYDGNNGVYFYRDATTIGVGISRNGTQSNIPQSA